MKPYNHSSDDFTTACGITQERATWIQERYYPVLQEFISKNRCDSEVVELVEEVLNDAELDIREKATCIFGVLSRLQELRILAPADVMNSILAITPTRGNA